MSVTLELHPRNPQKNRIQQTADAVRDGGLIAYPTDSSYAIGWRIGDKSAQDRVRRLRKLDRKHQFTLVCRDLAEIATYARVSNPAYRLLKSLTPGPYTFILPATHQVPKRLQHERRKTIGIRVPDHPIAQAVVEALDEPLLSSTLLMPDDDIPLNDAVDIEERIGHEIDVIVDGGPCSLNPTTVVDMVGDVPEVVRAGAGPIDTFA